MVQLLLGYDTVSTLAADALFGGNGDQQEHSEAQPQFLIIHWPWSSSMVQSDAWCIGWVGGRHGALNWLRKTFVGIQSPRGETCL